MDNKHKQIISVLSALETAVAAANEVSIYSNLERLKSLGERYSLATVAHLYEFGTDRVAKNLQLAFEWYKRAIELEEHDGYYALARFYLDGIHVERDLSLAAENFQKASDRGSIEARVMLGVCYLKGCGVKRDVDAARNFFASASESGYVIAWSFLSIIEYGRRHYLRALWLRWKCISETRRLTRYEPDSPKLFFYKSEWQFLK